MNHNAKRWLRTLIAAVSMLLLIGIPTFLLFLFGSLGMFPLYITRVILFVGIAGTITAAVAVCMPSGARAKRIAGCGFLLVCLVSTGYAGLGFYHDSIPSVDEAENRAAMLWEYTPFEEGNKLASLEQDASLQFDSPYTVSLDGATALYPVYAAFAQAVYPEVWPDSGAKIDYSPYHSTVIGRVVDFCPGIRPDFGVNRLSKGCINGIEGCGTIQ